MLTLIVGCSLGRGAGDRLSDVDGAIGLDAARGDDGAPLVRSVEDSLVAALPGMGTVVDVPPDGGPGADAAYTLTGEQVREQAFLGWVALIDLDKYLRRGSLWEAHARLNEARDRIWALWAAAVGALYPWHGLSQALDRDPALLPPGVESTVAGLDADGLRRAARASASILADVSAAAARRFPADLPDGMAAYVTGVLDQTDR